MTAEQALGQGGEFDAIRELVARWGSRASGIGDDAAVFRLSRGDAVVASVDTAVEGVHFRRDWLSAREIGYRAVVAALSDLAAMAARPAGILVAITLPASLRESLIEIGDGIGEAVDLVGTQILGGNLSNGAELSLSTTVFGSAFAPLARAGARPGDTIYVTGVLGGPAEAIRRLLRTESAGEYRERLVRPVPRLAEARWLADRGAAAVIDVSDGLIGDAGHLAAASAVCIALDSAAVPRMRGIDVQDAMNGGEEYELIVSSSVAFDVRAFAERFGLALTPIGRVIDGVPGTVQIDGSRVVRPAGYDHFSRR
jgi:thiamine-monophosphate kinase